MAALLCLVAIVQAQTKTNVLRVESVETPAGRTLTLPRKSTLKSVPYICEFFVSIDEIFVKSFKTAPKLLTFLLECIII